MVMKVAMQDVQVKRLKGKATRCPHHMQQKSLIQLGILQACYQTNNQKHPEDWDQHQSPLDSLDKSFRI